LEYQCIIFSQCWNNKLEQFVMFKLSVIIKIFPFWVMTLHCWQLWHSNITQNGGTCYWASISAWQRNTPNWKPYSKKLCHIIQKEIINKLVRLTNMCATSKPRSRHYTKKNYHSQNSEFTVMMEFPSRYLFFNLYTTQ
jgi:hypothetical protein